MTMRIGGGRFPTGYVKPIITAFKTGAAVKTSEKGVDPRKVFAYQLKLKVDEVAANMARFDVKKINLPRVGETRLKFSVNLPEDLRGIVEEGEKITVSLKYSVLPKDKWDMVLGTKVWVRNSTKIIP